MNKRQSLKDYQDCLEALIIEREKLSLSDLSMKLNLSKKIKEMNTGLDDIYINSYEFTELEEKYTELVKQLANFFKSNNILEPISILSTYSYLIKNGYLSFDHKFFYEKSIDDCIYLLGTNVISGFGVCRHITTLLTDIYKELGYDSYNISMVFEKTKSLSRQKYSSINEKKDLKYYLKKIQFILNSNLYNHLVTLVNTDNGSLIIDPTNDIVSYVNQSKRILSAIDQNTSFTCCYMPIFNLEEENNYDSILNITNEKYLDQIADNYNNSWDMISNNNYLASNLYNQNANLYKEVDYKRQILSREFNRYLG